jgi:hypothetical protein
VNVAVIAPAVVVEDATDGLPGGKSWLVAACGPATPDVPDAR